MSLEDVLFSVAHTSASPHAPEWLPTAAADSQRSLDTLSQVIADALELVNDDLTDHAPLDFHPREYLAQKSSFKRSCQPHGRQ